MLAFGSKVVSQNNTISVLVMSKLAGHFPISSHQIVLSLLAMSKLACHFVFPHIVHILLVAELGLGQQIAPF